MKTYLLYTKNVKYEQHIIELHDMHNLMGLGAEAGAAETFYLEPESEPGPFKTFDQLLYDLFITKFVRKIFSDLIL